MHDILCYRSSHINKQRWHREMKKSESLEGKSSYIFFFFMTRIKWVIEIIYNKLKVTHLYFKCKYLQAWYTQCEKLLDSANKKPYQWSCFFVRLLMRSQYWTHTWHILQICSAASNKKEINNLPHWHFCTYSNQCCL